MAEMIINVVATNLTNIIIAVLGIVVSVYVIPLIKNELKPWLEEKRLYDIVKKFVSAAEKMAESGAIQKTDKKAKVIKLLEKKGIVVTDEISALIEAAVKELDLVANTIVEEIKEEKTE